MRLSHDGLRQRPLTSVSDPVGQKLDSGGLSGWWLVALPGIEVVTH